MKLNERLFRPSSPWKPKGERGLIKNIQEKQVGKPINSSNRNLRNPTGKTSLSIY